MKYILMVAANAMLLFSCVSKQNSFDASGIFETDEVIVSSELSGKITALTIEEGDTVSMNEVTGSIDAQNLQLQKQQVQASIRALKERTADIHPQVKLLQQQLAVQQSQLENLLHEKSRTENLLRADAATGKQLDDINAQIDVAKKQISVTQQQINVQRSNVSTQNRSALSEGAPLQSRIDQLDDQIKRADIINPLSGTVIAMYAKTGEVTQAGKALYDVADLSTLTLRAYITGTQLSEIKLNQPVKVFTDKGEQDYRQYDGSIVWISVKAEFTPKSIQTREERANLVYAVKIKVKNDGYLKIGMYGEIKLK